MMAFVLRRLMAAIPTLLIVSVIVFGLMRLAPGDPAALMVGDLGDSERVERVREQMGLNEPLWTQYLIWLSHVVRGDLGQSFMTQQPVLGEMIGHFLVTLQVVGIAFVISSILAVFAGLVAGARRNTPLDLAIVTAATVLVSVPSFWVAMLLILLFSVTLGWTPVAGFVAIGENPGAWLMHIILPVVALVCVEVGVLTRLMRASTIEVLGQDYIDFARSKGLSERRVLMGHGLRNALVPTLPMLGLILSSLLSGTAVIETVFGIPGLGRFLVDAIYARDYPVIQGVLLFVVFIYALVNLIVDLAQAWLDPRVRPS